jgi:hypothetical protein
MSDKVEILEANADKPDLLSQKVRHRLFPAGLCGMGVGHESVRRKEKLQMYV